MDELTARIIAAIETFDGVPSTNGLASDLSLGWKVIKLRLTPDLKAAMERRGRFWIEHSTEKEFVAKVSEQAWLGHLPDYARLAVDERIKKIILKAIEEFDGVPTIAGLTVRIGLGNHAITTQFNPDLKAAMERRGRFWIEHSTEKEFVAKFSAGNLVSIADYAKELVEQRMHRIILRVIGECEGVPNVSWVGRKAGITEISVLTRMTPEIVAAMERRGRSYLESLSESEFLVRLSDREFVYVADYAKLIVEERMKRIILRTIEDFDGVPSVRVLARNIGLFDKTVASRLASDPDLWLAYHKKRGLSADQAVELALERDESSPAHSAALERRLRNLHAYREMIGIIKCFADLLKEKILEVSLYPKPLAKAAEDLGQDLAVVHVSMQAFRKGTKELPDASVAVVQSIHRLATEGLTSLFEEVHKSLGIGKTVLVTYGHEYAPTEDFDTALLAAGFMVKEQGVMIIDPPSKAELLAAGVLEANIERVARKLSGQSSVIILETVEGTNSVIPSLVKANVIGGAGIHQPSSETVDVPNVAKSIEAKFLQMTVGSLPADPYVVELTDEKDRRVALIGYDMDPRKPRSVETVVYRGAPAHDYRRIAREMARDVGLRRRWGVREQTKIKVGQLR